MIDPLLERVFWLLQVTVYGILAGYGLFFLFSWASQPLRDMGNLPGRRKRKLAVRARMAEDANYRADSELWRLLSETDPDFLALLDVKEPDWSVREREEVERKRQHKEAQEEMRKRLGTVDLGAVEAERMLNERLERAFPNRPGEIIYLDNYNQLQQVQFEDWSHREPERKMAQSQRLGLGNFGGGLS